MALIIRVNGNTHSVDVDGGNPLLCVLRDLLGMVGATLGCGMALCGACTVQLDARERDAALRETNSDLTRLVRDLTWHREQAAR